MHKQNHDGSFVWGNASSDRSHQVKMRAGGGVYLQINKDGNNIWVDFREKVDFPGRIGIPKIIDTSTGAYLSNDGQWVNASDKNMKERFVPIDGQEILDKLAGLSMSTWTHKNNPAVRHIGPMAQDFYGAFGMGGNDKAISTVDADGVSLAAIQGLYQLVKQENAELNKRIARLEAAIQNR